MERKIVTQTCFSITFAAYNCLFFSFTFHFSLLHPCRRALRSVDVFSWKAKNAEWIFFLLIRFLFRFSFIFFSLFVTSQFSSIGKNTQTNTIKLGLRCTHTYLPTTFFRAYILQAPFHRTLLLFTNQFAIVDVQCTSTNANAQYSIFSLNRSSYAYA